jgi:hypothetical protein
MIKQLSNKLEDIRKSGKVLGTAAVANCFQCHVPDLEPQILNHAYKRTRVELKRKKTSTA